MQRRRRQTVLPARRMTAVACILPMHDLRSQRASIASDSLTVLQNQPKAATRAIQTLAVHIFNTVGKEPCMITRNVQATRSGKQRIDLAPAKTPFCTQTEFSKSHAACHVLSVKSSATARTSGVSEAFDRARATGRKMYDGKSATLHGAKCDTALCLPRHDTVRPLHYKHAGTGFNYHVLVQSEEPQLAVQSITDKVAVNYCSKACGQGVHV